MMPGRSPSFWHRLFRWPKKIDPPKPGLPVLPPPLDCMRPEAEPLLLRVIPALLADDEPKLMGNEKSLPRLLGGHLWWEELIPPTSTEDKDLLQKSWQRMEELGRECDWLSWAGNCAFPSLTTEFAEAITQFQLGETLITAHGEYPHPWSALVYQAAVAAYNTVWLVTAQDEGANFEPVRAEGTATSRNGAQDQPAIQMVSPLEVERRRLFRWFDFAAKQPVAIGDFVLLRQLHNGLRQWLRTIARRVEDVNEELNRISRSLRVIGLSERLGPARGRIARLRQEELAAEQELRRTTAALSELDGLLGWWRALNPLSRLSGAGGSANAN